MLSEFWKAVSVVRRLGRDTEIAMLDACGDFSDVRNAMIRATGRKKRERGESEGANPQMPCAIVATALARIALAEIIQRMCINGATDYALTTLAYRAHAFARTHADLLMAIDWSSPDGYTDCALLRDFAAPSATRFEVYGKTWTCIANACYPFDGRVLTEEDLLPIASELMACGFFDQVSDPDSSKTPEHVIKKILPRACEKRAGDSIMEQTSRFVF